MRRSTEARRIPWGKAVIACLMAALLSLAALPRAFASPQDFITTERDDYKALPPLRVTLGEEDASGGLPPVAGGTKRQEEAGRLRSRVPWSDKADRGDRGGNARDARHFPGQTVATPSGQARFIPAKHTRDGAELGSSAKTNAPHDLRSSNDQHREGRDREMRGHGGAALQPRSSTASTERSKGLASAPLRERDSEEKATLLGLPLVSTGASLAIVLGLFLLLAWFFHRKQPPGSEAIPRDVLEVLGKSVLPGKQQLHLLRCGGKLLLVCTSPSMAETLTEIADPDEVARLTALCREANPRSSSQAFRQALLQVGRRAHRPGFIDDARGEGAVGESAREARHA